jgi:hypothetical protein
MRYAMIFLVLIGMALFAAVVMDANLAERQARSAPFQAR